MNLKRKLAALMLTVTFLSGAACADIIIEGSTTVLPVAQRVAEEYMNANGEVEISIRGGGSGVGINSLISGKCDIADSSRPIKDGELTKAAGKKIYPKAYVVAMDGIAIIVNKQNEVTAMTKQQVKDIYTGKISNWAQLGAKDKKIVVISRDSASGTFEAFNELALNKEKVRQDALMQASNQAIVTTVSKTPGAIGYVGLGYVNSTVEDVEIEGVIPTKNTVLSGKYPYSRPLFMYTNGEAKGEVKEFIDFLLSADGQQIVEQEGFVPLK